MRYFSKSEAFARDYLKVHRVTVQVQEPIPYTELRRMKNGIEFYIDRLHETILVRFPGMDLWIEFEKIRKLSSLQVMQAELYTTLPDERLVELNRILKLRGKAN